MSVFKIRKGILPFSFVLLLTSTTTVLAFDGDQGQSSTGKTNIQLVIPQLVKIRADDLIDLGQWDGTSTITGNASTCVQSNADFPIDIVATSTNNAFQLADPDNTNTDVIAYEVFYENTKLTYNDSATAPTVTVDSNSDLSTACTKVANRIRVDITNQAASAVTPDTYTDTLLLTVAPQ